MLTGTESSAERLELLLPEKTESEPGSDSGWADQMLGSESGFPMGSPASMMSSLGKSRKSSKKLPQSISSMKLGPVIFLRKFGATQCETMGGKLLVISFIFQHKNL